MSIQIRNDHTQEILDYLKEATHDALTDVGMIASGDIAEFIRGEGIVDTGLLRNSITFALSGESAQIGSYTADKGEGQGEYTGKAPMTKNLAVYIGTNVEYAKYVQFGTSKMPVARDFMFAPLRANIEEYKNILMKYLGGQ